MSTELTDETAEARFLAKAEVAPNGCWLWTATLINSGYGRFWFNGKTELAHRVAYELFVGEIPAGLTIDHTCHTRECNGGVICEHRRCVNPDHLEPVTQRINLLRGNTIIAANAAKTHCLRGHEFTVSNTVWYKDRLGRPFRYCLRCERQRYIQRRPHHE